VLTAEQWFKRATENLQVAELSMPHDLYDPAFFHAQQCVEKSIKAALTHQGTRLPSP
jgi:HEPN domain-containing protein